MLDLQTTDKWAWNENVYENSLECAIIHDMNIWHLPPADARSKWATLDMLEQFLMLVVLLSIFLSETMHNKIYFLQPDLESCCTDKEAAAHSKHLFSGCQFKDIWNLFFQEIRKIVKSGFGCFVSELPKWLLCSLCLKKNQVIEVKEICREYGQSR